ncbi:MAG: acyl-CoA dehydrogenase [Chloroflexota bacterium]
MTNQTTSLENTPQLLTLLPFIYVAWADAVLEPDEIRALNQRLETFAWLEPAAKKQLAGWLNPDLPPSPMEMHRWLTLIQKMSRELPEQADPSLVDIGMNVALIRREIQASPKEIRSSLESLDDLLGVASVEAARQLLAREVRPLRPILEREEARFDVALLHKFLERDYPEARKRVRDILDDPQFDYLYFDHKDEYRDHVLYWAQLLADEGIGAISYPSAYGGRGEMGEYLAAMEMLAHHDLSLLIKFGVQFGLFGGSILLLGTEKHHKKYLRDAGTLVLPGCFAMTELGHGSNVRDIETTATFNREAQTFTIHTPTDLARKEYIGNAARHGRLATVFAQLIIDGENYGVNAFLVPIRTEEGQAAAGVRIQDNGRKLGLNGVDNGRLWFDQVTIPLENMLDRFGKVTPEGDYVSEIAGESKRFFTILGTLVGGRVGIALSANSVAKNGLAIAIRYANRRRQFGPENEEETLLIDYPSHQRRLLPLLSKVFALDFALKYLVERYVGRSEADSREVETLAAALKAYSSWNATSSLQEAREATGGMGYMARNRLAALKADSDIFTTFEGDNTVLLQLVAKGRLTEFRQQFEDDRIWGVVKFLAKQAGQSLIEHNPILARRVDRDHLLDLEWHVDLFQHREDQLVVEAANQLRYWMGKAKDSNVAMLKTQNLLLEVGHAYVERLVLASFVNGIDQVSDEPIKAVLSEMAALFALITVEENMTWYLEHGDIAAIKSKKIREMVDQLLEKLAGQALYLVDAFGIPDRLLAAPIGIRSDSYDILDVS